MRRFSIATALVAVALLAACGDHKGAGINPPTKAVLMLSSSGTSTQIYGIDVTITLPPGVTVRSSTPPQVDADAIAASGMAASGSLAAGLYTAAAGTAPAQVRVLLVNANGFGTGEFGTVNCDIGNGIAPAESDFPLSLFSAFNANGDEITGLSAGLKIDLH